jgi:hypothetical protein
LERLRKIAKLGETKNGTTDGTLLEMVRIAEFIVKRWEGKTP